ncbi:MAG: glycine zipper 2TM domain-containing protein [Pseudomonadota bacterium]
MVLKGRFALVTLVAALTLAGCASSTSGSVYSREETRREATVRMGTLESVRHVTIEGTKTPVGTIAGGAVGGIAGSSIGSGRGSTIGAVLGAVAGGLLGSAAEEGVTRKPGVELTVRLDNGELRTVVQEADETFNVGERVRLITQGGVTRVSH